MVVALVPVKLMVEVSTFIVPDTDNWLEPEALNVVVLLPRLSVPAVIVSVLAMVWSVLVTVQPPPLPLMVKL
jgi:hypothetical protein